MYLKCTCVAWGWRQGRAAGADVDIGAPSNEITPWRRRTLLAYLRHAALGGNDVVGLVRWFSLAKARFTTGYLPCSLRELVPLALHSCHIHVPEPACLRCLKPSFTRLKIAAAAD